MFNIFEFEMDPAHLELDEVQYELKIRGVSGISGQRRCSTALRAMLRQEAANPRQAEIPNTVDVNIEEELATCEYKIGYLVEACNSTNTLRSENQILIIGSRIVHLSKRIRRLNGDDARSVERIETLMSQINSVIETITQATRTVRIPTNESGATAMPFNTMNQNPITPEITLPISRISRSEGAKKSLFGLTSFPNSSISNHHNRNTRSNNNLVEHDRFQDIDSRSNDDPYYLGYRQPLTIPNSGELRNPNNNTLNQRTSSNLNLNAAPFRPSLPNVEHPNGIGNQGPFPQSQRNVTESRRSEVNPFAQTNRNFLNDDNQTKRNNAESRHPIPKVPVSFVNNNQNQQNNFPSDQPWRYPNTVTQYEQNQWSHNSRVPNRYEGPTNENHRSGYMYQNYQNTSRTPTYPYGIFPNPQNVQYMPDNTRRFNDENLLFDRPDPFVRNNVQLDQPRPMMNNRRCPVSKWGIWFSGDERETSLNDFLSQVELFARAERVTEAELLAAAIYLFKGSAKTWYRAFHSYFPDWNSLVAALREQFLPHDYDYWLYKEIEQRRQDESEDFGIFLAAMEMLFRNLSVPLPEAAKLDIVIRNMLPIYTDRIDIDDIFSLRELKLKCKNIERNRFRLNRRTVPTIPRRDLLEPAFAQPTPYRNNVSEFQIQTSSESFNQSTTHTSIENDNDVQGTKAHGSEQNRLLCFNCNVFGHHFNNCSLPRGKFCYTCGFKNVTILNCPKCNQTSENQRAGYQDGAAGGPRNVANAPRKVDRTVQSRN